MKKENFNTALLIVLVFLFGFNIFPLQSFVTFKEVPASDYLGRRIEGIRMIQASVSYGVKAFGLAFEIGRPTQISYFAIPK